MENSDRYTSLPISHSKSRERRAELTNMTGVSFTGSNTNSEHLIAAQALTGGRSRSSGVGGQVTRQAPTMNMEVNIHRQGPTYGSSYQARDIRSQQRDLVVSGERGLAESLSIREYGRQPAFQRMDVRNPVMDVEYSNTLTQPMPYVTDTGNISRLSHTRSSMTTSVTSMFSARMGVPEDNPQLRRAVNGYVDRNF